MAATKKSGGEQSFAKLPVAGKIGLLGLILGLVGGVYYFVFHVSVSDEIDGARSRQRALHSQMSEAEARNAEYVRLRSELTAREGLDRGNLRALPESAETASFLQDLNRLGELSGLHLVLVQPQPEEPDTHYVRLPVTLRLQGRYHQLARFFHNVSRLDRLISMEDIHLQQPTLQGEEVHLSVDVLATTYRRPAPEQPAAPAAGQGG
jgi:type IV pilus assembly protein PilO